MKIKKSKKADLEKRKGLFLQIGFIITLALVFLAFEYSVTEINTNSLGELQDLQGEEEMIPITRKEEVKPPEVQPPKKVAEVLNIVQDDIEIENEFQIEDFDASQDEEIVIANYEETEEEEDVPVMFVADMPLFKDGKDHATSLEIFRQWVIENLDYPQIAIENGVEGVVYTKFVINSKGIIDRIVILRGVDPAINAEAIRILESAPKWTPGRQQGRAVPVTCGLAIRFQLN
ncbi:energy transducer TonB [Bacteroidota bacterium]